MNAGNKKTRPERDRTDESLLTERKKTDQAIVARRMDVEESADMVLSLARDQADAVLGIARGDADRKLAEAEEGAGERGVIVRERALEDERLQRERAAADEGLQREREQRARALAALLPLEREKTDRYLLTERVRSDEAVAHRDDIMGMISHDLRNLLSSIVLTATLVSDEASDSDEGRRVVHGMSRIQRYVARMDRLVGDMIDVASIDAGKLAIQSERADAAALITEAVDAFAQAASEKGISLDSDAPAGTLLADFDHDRMLQVLANLISNALKFTPRGGRIAVRGERDGHELRLSVSDTGTGIADDMLDAVFERFWQVGKNDKRGLGLGLYISKCIVVAHGGKIWVESRMGAGSTFYFTIPGHS